MPVEALKKIEPSVQPLNGAKADEAFCSGFTAGDWSDLRYLVAVKEAGSLREAARRLKVSVNTVRSRLVRLERSTGSRILDRHFRGASLTDAGERLYNVASRFSQAASAGSRNGFDGLRIPGTLSIGCTEGVGTSWLTPRVSELSSRISPIRIDLQFDYDLQKDRSAWVDLGLTYRPPVSGELIVAKVAMIHLMFFAAPAYLSLHGTPRTVDDLRHHHFVEQSAPGYNSSGLDLVLGADRSPTNTLILTNSGLTQAYAAAHGSGIALLPSYTRAITRSLVPLAGLPTMRVPLSYFFHEEARHVQSVRAAVDWLREAFDSRTFPWFSDHFVHPDDFPNNRVEEERVTSMFPHFLDQVVC